LNDLRGLSNYNALSKVPWARASDFGELPTKVTFLTRWFFDVNVQISVVGVPKKW